MGTKARACKLSSAKISPTRATSAKHAVNPDSQPLEDVTAMRPTRSLVESTNALDATQLFQKHFPQELWRSLLETAGMQKPRSLQVENVDARSLTAMQLDACLDLVEQTSSEDYRNSEAGWSRSKKRREMKLPDLRYILLSESSSENDSTALAGFISFMVTYEDSHEVIYIYEIHFVPEFQGKGLGKQLMEVIEALGVNIGVEKTMLTVFRANARASEWYNKLGYSVDEFSPPARRLRGGKVKEPTYTILSKRLPGSPPPNSIT